MRSPSSTVTRATGPGRMWSSSASSCPPEVRRSDGLTLEPAGPLLGRLGLAILRRSVRLQLAEEGARRLGHGVDGALERRRVGLRRLGETAHLAHVLEGGVADLLF